MDVFFCSVSPRWVPSGSVTFSSSSEILSRLLGLKSHLYKRHLMFLSLLPLKHIQYLSAAFFFSCFPQRLLSLGLLSLCCYVIKYVNVSTDTRGSARTRSTDGTWKTAMHLFRPRSGQPALESIRPAIFAPTLHHSHLSHEILILSFVTLWKHKEHFR